ncbi:YpdA family putative bacillithiol disulfide reductase [Sphingobacterium corticibacter]|uniref:YpdA family putative bacillithiol disulfide reductase n=1 Tax=Sphingobacterium corticibacter TaxID=2171749 RepID=A0A2T8HEL3_9SPHI|nr:YpdA family putative bacillithiol disulfide reductase [Sphingobacterium corticibacter]PVH23881.1 YpdA family putative bacillithiol disulfide reductase [Sphingobacterium corticibacter]
MHNEVYDVLIIGGGPIGLACGIAAKANNLSHLILEKGCLTNSLYNYPVNMTFFSSAEKLEVGGIPFVTTNPKPKRAEALEYYRRIDSNFNLNTRLFEEVRDVTKDQNTGLFTISSSRSVYLAKHVIVATGFYDIPMQMNIPGEDLPKVRHYYDDPHYYAKQNVVVIGASNSSIDAALETYRKGANVTLVIRRSEISPRVKYWVRPDIDNRLAAGEIQVYFESCLSEISEQAVKIRTPQEEIEIENDFVLALTGYRPNFAFLEHIGIEVPEDGARIPQHNDATMETNVAGLYLAGVVCGGLNTHLWFIENSRVHADLIIKDIANKLTLL